jgi:hypothetical protein
MDNIGGSEGTDEFVLDVESISGEQYSTATWQQRNADYTFHVL